MRLWYYSAALQPRRRHHAPRLESAADVYPWIYALHF